MIDTARFTIGKREYTYNRNGRIAVSEVIIQSTRSLTHPETRRCLICRYASQAKSSARCTRCLDTDDLNEFELDEYIPADLKKHIQKLTKEENGHEKKRNP